MGLSLIDGVIPFVGGLYFSLLAFRVIGKKPGESAKWDEWHRRYGVLMRVLAPLSCLFGLFVIAQNLLR